MNQREIRIVTAGLRVEARAEDPGGERRKLVGHAAVFDQWTTLYEGRYWSLKEVVRPGAFRNAISEAQDVVALVNHDRNLLLGRTASKTLHLREDSRGLLAEIDPPDTQAARDLIELVERGDISGMSFAFGVRPGGEVRTEKSEGDRDITERELTDLNLFDVSLVTRPAYPQTDVDLRHFEPERRDRTRRDPWLDRAWARLRLARAGFPSR